MTKSKKYQGKFTAEEVEIIKNFQNEFGMNDNQLVKNSVNLYVVLLTGVKALQDNPTMMNFLKKMDKHQQKTMDKKQIVKYLENEFSQNPKDLEKFEDDFENLSKTEEVLEKKKKSGPRRIKKKRGRPDS